MQKTFLIFPALFGFVAAPQAATATVIANVSPGEQAGMQQLYAITNQSGDAFNQAYTTDNSGSISTGSFTRVAYYFEVQWNATHPQGAGPLQWAWASMDTFNADPTLVGVPRAGTGITETGTVVSNLNIESNHPDLAAVVDTGKSGIIEFWASNYNNNGGGQFGSDDSLFDWKDSGGTSVSGHGSFQVFAFTDANQNDANTVFGITQNGGLGVGTGTAANSPDWTFGPDETTYDVKNLEIWVGSPIPEPSGALLFGLGAVATLLRRRR